MSAFESNHQLDLLGQAPPPAPAVQLHGATEPQLDLGWGQFHQGFFSNFRELFRFARAPRDFLVNNFFRDSWVERRLPRRAIFAAALWHVAILTMPFPDLSGPGRTHAFDNLQLAWSGPVQDFPLLEIPAAKPKSLRRSAQPAPSASDGFHPRQRIFTDPVHPNHPRQTLINPAAPPVAPKLLPELPNIVQLAKSAEPLRPRLEISQETLKKLRPRGKRAAVQSAAAPDVQFAEQQHSADLDLVASNSGPERPKLQINANSAPRAAQRKPDAAADPDVSAAQLASPNGSAQALIALSANPGPPAPVAPPAGNLSARVALSPEGKTTGASAGSPDAKSPGDPAAGAGSVGISISGGSPNSAKLSSGLSSGRLAMPSSRPNYARAEADRASEEPVVRTTPPNFAALAPGAKPEAIFARRRVYSLNVNMPNLNSATGSWILNFSELRSAPTGPASLSGELAEPSPIKKVDPKYPPNAVAEHIEGEVVLYAVIRRDGSVDSIQLVKGIDDQLNANAIHALAQWKFRPAERNGDPVEMEAIAHIPFHAPER